MVTVKPKEAEVIKINIYVVYLKRVHASYCVFGEIGRKSLSSIKPLEAINRTDINANKLSSQSAYIKI